MLPPWLLMKKNLRNPCRARESTTSRTTVTRVMGRRVIDPGKAMWCSDIPTERVGATAAPVSSADRHARVSAQMASVPMSPVGPCCSVAPMGTMTPSESSRYLSTSGQDMSCSRMVTPSVYRAPGPDVGCCAQTIPRPPSPGGRDQVYAAGRSWSVLMTSRFSL